MQPDNELYAFWKIFSRSASLCSVVTMSKNCIYQFEGRIRYNRNCGGMKMMNVTLFREQVR